jgi:hypothetical protein
MAKPPVVGDFQMEMAGENSGMKLLEDEELIVGIIFMTTTPRSS